MHFLENFMPIVGDEPFAVKMLAKAAEIPFYQRTYHSPYHIP